MTHRMALGLGYLFLFLLIVVALLASVVVHDPSTPTVSAAPPPARAETVKVGPLRRVVDEDYGVVCYYFEGGFDTPIAQALACVAIPPR